MAVERLALAPKEAAAAAGIGRTLLYAAVATGALKARKCGRRTLILQDDLRAWLASLPAPPKRPGHGHAS